MSLKDIKHILLVLSGKGGVGKSSITTQLALTLSLQGHSVGVLDIDLTGPSIPRFFGIEDAKVTQAPGGLVPVQVHAQSTSGSTEGDGSMRYGALSCMSLGFILSGRNQAVIWRGPKKTAMVRQFLTSTLWPSGLNYLLIDTPPGTSDEHISLVESLLTETASNPSQLAGAVVVTTPQAISVSDVKKELNFCRKVGVKVLGVVENMAGFVCPHCMECTNVFSAGGGAAMAIEFGVPFLGSVPLDPAFVGLIEEGIRPVYPQGTVVEGQAMETEETRAITNRESDKAPLVEKYTSCSLYPIFAKICKQVTDVVEITPASA
ncbi:cytosolic Fe-S cluster assembling factor cfd1 [Rhizodiscina lignyota]|uniref:Cytosolic Fe-S cluster assembling factor cfd1 n=1 Tax=Rhizodiscina lignyota TaxID=1504668 RepID=A0A9P4I6M1_9PEZI|nr:cytosolic Fe-S cluster assembling factor cfd1 [Rhizodiscina lignyota]